VTYDLDWTTCMTVTTGCLLGTSWIHDVTSLPIIQNNTDLMDITYVSPIFYCNAVVKKILQFCRQTFPAE